MWVSKEKKSREPLSRAATILEEKEDDSFKRMCHKKTRGLEAATHHSANNS